MKQPSLLFLLLVLTISSSCSSLSVRTEYLSHEQLASYYIDTPDPRLDQPMFGQRLIISWCLPKQILKDNQVIANITARFKNGQQEEKQIFIKDMIGTYLYTLDQQKYSQVGGILTYKVELWKDTCLIEKWQHPLWEELITFEPVNSPPIK